MLRRPPKAVARASAAALTAALIAPAAAEESTDEPSPPDQKAERRSGFVLGVVPGLSLGNATGNPQALAAREDPAHTARTGFATGGHFSLFLGGALTDWFTFGLGMTGATLQSGSLTSAGGGFVFHIEAFPLFRRGGAWRDLGLAADFGAGSATIVTNADKTELATSGASSIVGLGAFWEPVRFWQISSGPFLGYHHQWSFYFARNELTAGYRLVFYGGP
jgi:hypothetical protein